MSWSFKIAFFLLIFSGLTAPVTLYAQGKTNPETEYLRIKTIAFEGRYAEAEAAARQLVGTFPKYGDARILLGRILGWQKKYDEALAELDTVLISEPANSDALSAKQDINSWSRGNNPGKNEIRTGYYFDTFTLPYKRFWQIFSASAAHRFNWGKGSAGINFGRMNTQGRHYNNLQYEVEAWPVLSAKNYAYLEYAYSPDEYFPRHRASVEIWQVLPAGWAISGGLNYYYFNRSVFIASLSAEKYIDKYWMSAKGYLCFKQNGVSPSVYLNFRRYFGDTDFLQTTLGLGTAPDEPWDIQTDLSRYSAYSLRLTYNVSLLPQIGLRLGGGYSREEYLDNLWRNRFEGGISLIYFIRSK